MLHPFHMVLITPLDSLCAVQSASFQSCYLKVRDRNVMKLGLGFMHTWAHSAQDSTSPDCHNVNRHNIKFL
jgi:hypothetical protein